ncbi:DUF4190 domain-containing protein [Peribacillus loiseleuriae]|uniref:DUF4190 domain-containing protein n=1 Tax=Peribacillus loiseleuriae TaxID=1679170 RepID=A0A0K9GVD0_9BACI|nr:DUF4190 domain-containing protein [Peribacillus loiseleuriae]KMY50217.1 hypothetical protein AC625_12500 [Peribacillus loiseleuriae]
MVEKTQTNSHSIISLINGILSILIPFIGLILGVIGVVFSRKAVKQIEKTNESGRGLAIAGLICAVVGITLQFLSVLGLILFYSVTITSSINIL